MILWDRQLKTQPCLSTNSTWNWSLSSSKVWFQFRKWLSAVLWSHSAVKAKSCLPRCDTPELYLEAKWQQSVLLCKPSYWNKYFPFVKQKCSLKNTPVMQSMMCLIFFKVCSNHTPYTLQWTGIWKQFAVHDSDIPVILTEGQGHQTWYNARPRARL